MQSRIAWETINEVSRRKSAAKAKLKAANQQERIKLWKQHFENLLGNPPKVMNEPITRIISKQLDIKLGLFTKEGLDSVLRKIKNRKAPDPPEVWKTRQFDAIMLRQCNAVNNQKRIERWMKGCILPFPIKGDPGLAKNYQGITFTSISAKIYNALQRNCIEPKIVNIVRKNQNGFRRNRSTTSQILTIRRILEKPTGDITICRLYQGLRFHPQREDGTNPTSIRPTKRNRSSNNNSLQKHQSENTFTGWRHRILRHCSRSTTRGHASPYLFIICLDYVHRTSIDKTRENGFELTKKRGRRYPAKTDADYADDIALLANTPNQAETLLHSLERTATGIGLHVNAHKTEYMSYNQTGDIFTLERTSLILVDNSPT